MFDWNKLAMELESYKQDFTKGWWQEERYKWIAVKHFQDNWDVNATGFAAMLDKALAKTYNLLAAGFYYPRQVITDFAKKDPETVRNMFINLYDESRGLEKRIENFKSEAEKLKEEHLLKGRNHFQDENSISTYLWLRYPDNYYIFKFGIFRDFGLKIGSEFIPKKGAGAPNVVEGFKLYNEVSEFLAQDKELVKLLQSSLDEECYPDPKLKTLTIDVGYYLHRPLKRDKWIMTELERTISVAEWLELLADKSIFTQSSLEIMKRMKDFGSEATCSQLAEKYGESYNFYNSGSSALAKRISQRMNLGVVTPLPNAKWWPILYMGRHVDSDEKGVFVWKLREELSEALDQFDLSDVNLYAKDKKGTSINYWWLVANPKIWSFSELPVGEHQNYTHYNERGNKRRIFQNFVASKNGDLIIGYESNPVKQIVALAQVINNANDKLEFKKIEGLESPIDLNDLKLYQELENMEFLQNPNGSLFKLSETEYEFLMDLIREENPVIAAEKTDEYTKKDFLQEVYLDDTDFGNLHSLLLNKKNLIIQGPPGTGKTYMAKRLAYAIMGEEDDSRIEFIQFHQNYSYEDFIMGYKPKEDGFELKYGIFYKFHQKAANNPEKDFFFIIDEINRGNISKIFGELLMLIENDYRGTFATLAYNGRPFSVPKNLYIIGMMNTADRSLAMIDYALRRRFVFFDMQPGFDSDGFKAYQESLNNSLFDELIKQVKDLNNTIKNDASLGEGFTLGHSYFCNQEEVTKEWINRVIEFELIPMLKEYWWDNSESLQNWKKRLRGVLHD